MSSRLDRIERPLPERQPAPGASINFVTAHDGFTLRDLVSYNEKHNEANGEDNADGESHNRSWNCGTEGPTDDCRRAACRAVQQRNLLATLFLSQGVPMLLGGDELGRTQGGNNNAYCQDNEVSWFDWGAVDEELLAFTQRLIALRRDHPVLRRRRWFQGRPIRGTIDILWFRPDGSEMTDEDWEAGFARSIAVLLDGDALRARDERGRPIVDDSFLMLFNAHHEHIDWVLPGSDWELVLDSTSPTGVPDEPPNSNGNGNGNGNGSDGVGDGSGSRGVTTGGVPEPGDEHRVPGRAVLVFRRPR
jgi:isoamylase